MMLGIPKFFLETVDFALHQGDATVVVTVGDLGCIVVVESVLRIGLVPFVG
jgi:hypothetical protein